MRRVVVAVACLCLVVVTGLSLSVQGSQSGETRFLPMLGDDVVLHMMAVVDARLTTPHGRPDEYRPPSLDTARRIVDMAAVAATARWCGVTWNGAAAHRPPRVGRDGRFAGYDETLHAVAFEMFERDLRAANCSARRRAEVANFLAAYEREGVILAFRRAAAPR